MIRFGMVVALGLCAFAAPAMAQSAAPAAAETEQAAPAEAAALSVDTQLGVLLESPAAKAVLDRHLTTQFTENPQISMAASMPLSALAQYLPTLTPELLAAINADLTALN